MFGTETWLNDNVLNSELDLDEYHVLRRDRQDKEGGGVFLCIKKHFNSILIHKSKQSELVFAKIPIPRKPPVIVGCVYRAPKLNYEDCKKLCDEIREIKLKHKNSVFLLGGDFNIPDIDWNELSITKSQYSQSINQLFLDLSQDLGLFQNQPECK